MVKREKVTTLTSRPVVLPIENVDTDQIIPARYLTTTTREGLGAHLFRDWRYDDNGSPRTDFILNHPSTEGRTILVAGHNFGCGSSREHAPWALTDYGFRAVISTDIADIFYNNALKNGLLPIRITHDAYERILMAPNEVITISLEESVIQIGENSPVTFRLEPFARYCLLTGLDELGFLLARENDISMYEANPR